MVVSNHCKETRSLAEESIRRRIEWVRVGVFHRLHSLTAHLGWCVITKARGTRGEESCALWSHWSSRQHIYCDGQRAEEWSGGEKLTCSIGASRVKPVARVSDNLQVWSVLITCPSANCQAEEYHWAWWLRGQGQQCIRPDSPPEVTRLSQTVISGSMSITDKHTRQQVWCCFLSHLLNLEGQKHPWNLKCSPLLWGEYLCCAWRGWGLNTPLNEQRFYFSDLLQTVYDWLTKQILLSQTWRVTSLPHCWNCNSC